ncbi:hypothetical protein GCM10022291_18410 [Postechiella marina]|uniref:Response regulatory domain-containing protein n=1 Tax=Postechiella marina TaxID=943941 RepID=A0ABP8C8T0_9FLAO
MNNIKNVLIVEDEPIIVHLLRKIFENLREWNFIINSAKTCDIAIQKINNSVISNHFDLVVLDINIPPSIDGKTLSGEDIGIKLRECFPVVKIIVCTSSNDNYRLNNILQTINPEGFLIKTDIDYKNIVDAINRVLVSPPYYSNKILNLIRQHISNDFVLDSIDRLMLYQLSKGTKTKDLPNLVNLSKGGVERRKRHLKEVFDVGDEGDKKLLELAKEKGYI